MSTRTTGIVWICTLACLPSIAGAQDLDRVRALYVAAAYEEALAAMPVASGEPARTDLEQYRALCLLALGREPEAVAALERLVRAHPTFVPPASETSPRMAPLLSAVRARLVPDVLAGLYADGESALGAMNREAAYAAFQRTIETIDRLPEGDRARFADLRGKAIAARDRAAPVIEPVPRLGPGAYVGPVPIREALPSWNPPDSTASRTEYLGLLRVEIDARGRVQSAVMVRSAHPVYDTAVLRAAKQFVYKPATLAGRPVPAQKDIELRLLPH